MLTPARRRALEIVRDHGTIAPGHFAEHMWPDSPCWRKVYKCGPYGASSGIAMATAAGGFLGKLRRDDLVSVAYFAPPRYALTWAGRRALEVGRA